MTNQELYETITEAIKSGQITTVKSECERLGVSPTVIHTRERRGKYWVIWVDGRQLLINKED